MKVKVTLEVNLEIYVDGIEDINEAEEDGLDWEIEDAVSEAIAAGVTRGLFPDTVTVGLEVESKITEWE